MYDSSVVVSEQNIQMVPTSWCVQSCFRRLAWKRGASPYQHPPLPPAFLSGLHPHRNEQQINVGLIKDDWKLLIGVWEGSLAARSQDEYGFSLARDCKHC